MCSFVFTEPKAICLFFVTLFVPALASTDDKVFFITRPKDKEIFVGEDVQFDWEYARRDVQEVHFGVILPNKKEMAIYKKRKDGTVAFNNAYQAIEWISHRVEIILGRRASFKINSVQMEDTGTYYCTLVLGQDKLIPHIDLVNLTVVDLLINKRPSTQTKESWQGHKITVACAVRVPLGETRTKFSWMHIPSNRTVARKFHDDTRSKSYLTITTYKDEDFEALQCRAETKATVKFHIINITKLTSPSEPRNLTAERSFDKQNAQPYIRLRWDPPDDNGGAVISSYIISYIPSGLPWKSSTNEETQRSEFYELKLPGGKIYNVVVRAKNKAGVSPPSNKVEINLEDIPHVSKLHGNKLRHHLESTLLLLSFLVWFL